MPAGVRLRMEKCADPADGWRPVGKSGLDPQAQAWVSAALRAAAPESDDYAALGYCRLPDGSSLLFHRGDRANVGVVDAVRFADPRGGQWAIAAWGAPLWGQPSRSGATADGADLVGSVIDEDALPDFARERQEQVPAFLADVRGLFDDPAGRQIVVVGAQPRDIAHWIALATASLPDAQAAALTFLTDTTAPGTAPQQILGVRPETLAQADLEALRRDFRVHGLRQDEPVGSEDPWAVLVADLWRLGVPANRLCRRAGPDAAPFAADVLFRGVLEGGPELRDGVFAAGVAQWAAEPGHVGTLGGTQRAALRVHAMGWVRDGRDPSGADPVGLVERIAAEFGACGDHEGQAELEFAIVEPKLHAIVACAAAPPADPATLVPADPERRVELARRYGPGLATLLGERLHAPLSAWADHAALAAALDMGKSGTTHGESGVIPEWDSTVEKVTRRLSRVFLEDTEYPEPAVDLVDRLAVWSMRSRVLAVLEEEARQGEFARVLAFAGSPEGKRFIARPGSELPASPFARTLVLGIQASDGRRTVEEAAAGLAEVLRGMDSSVYHSPLTEWARHMLLQGLLVTLPSRLRDALAAVWQFPEPEKLLREYADWQNEERHREELARKIVANPVHIVGYFDAWYRPAAPGRFPHERDSESWARQRRILLTRTLRVAASRLSRDAVREIRQAAESERPGEFIHELVGWINRARSPSHPGGGSPPRQVERPSDPWRPPTPRRPTH